MKGGNFRSSEPHRVSFDGIDIFISPRFSFNVEYIPMRLDT